MSEEMGLIKCPFYAGKSSVPFSLVASFFSGCDNRSQLEKDADAAGKKINNALK